MCSVGVTAGDGKRRRGIRRRSEWRESIISTAGGFREFRLPDFKKIGTRKW
jgi:hypothetical protein